MAISSDRLFCPPEVEIDWFGLQGRAYEMQACGWKFEAMEAHDFRDDPFRARRQLIMRHPSGLTAMASCDERQLIEAVNIFTGRGGYGKPCFRVERVAAKPAEFGFIGRPEVLCIRPLDMTPGLVDEREVHLSRFSLASLYPERPAEEIIVEPATVMGLLEQIKQLQAPDLARIREENRKRDARDRVHEVRHATIMSIAA